MSVCNVERVRIRDATSLAVVLAVAMSLVLAPSAVASMGNRINTANAIRTYVNGLGMTRAVTSSEPGSPAWKLALHDIALNEALVANRQRASTQSKQFVDGRAIVCPQRTTRGPTCSMLSNFATDASGHITDFVVDGIPLSRRIAIGSGRPVGITSSTGTVGLVGLESAYQAGNGQLAVIVDFASLANPPAGVLTLSEDAIRYQSIGGQSAMADSLLNERSPKNPSFRVKSARNLLRVVLFFHGQTLGGQLIVTTVGNPPTPALAGTGQVPIA